MKTYPIPALVAAVAALIALPFSVAAAGTLFLTAWLGVIIHADYTLRRCKVRLPRCRTSKAPFHAYAVATETHRLAA
ncbi:MAG: hypothetical protein V4773_20870 [Verrucomicrobiota bacterium]